MITPIIGYHPYKKLIESNLTDAHRAERNISSNCVWTNLCKEQTMKILFSNERIFDNDDSYNSHKDRI